MIRHDAQVACTKCFREGYPHYGWRASKDGWILAAYCMGCGMWQGDIDNPNDAIALTPDKPEYKERTKYMYPIPSREEWKAVTFGLHYSKKHNFKDNT